VAGLIVQSPDLRRRLAALSIIQHGLKYMTDRVDSSPADRAVEKWKILAVLFLVTTLNYGIRSGLSFSAPQMSKELGLSPFDLGLIFSAFGWSYALSQIPGGYLLDRYGVVAIYGTSILLWSLITFFHAMVGALTGSSVVLALIILRVLLGFAEAPSFPGNAKLVSSWFPVSERGFASGVFNSAQYFSAILFAPYCIFSRFSWMARSIYSARISRRGTVWLVDCCRERGARSVRTESGETQTCILPPKARQLRFRSVCSRQQVSVYIAQFFINGLTVFFITWLPLYLVEEKGLTIVQAGIATGVPSAFGFAGGLLGGLVSDLLVRRGIPTSLARKVVVFIGMLLSLSIILCNFVSSYLLIIIVFSIAYFGKGFGAIGWAVITDISSHRTLGLSGGVFNMVGNLSTIFVPIAVGYLVATTGSYSLAIAMMGCFAMLAAACYSVQANFVRRLNDGEQCAIAWQHWLQGAPFHRTVRRRPRNGEMWCKRPINAA